MIKSVTLNEEVEAIELSRKTQIAEAEFIEKLKSGDAATFDKLVIRYIDDVYSLLLRLTADNEEACDLTQETFLRALRGIKSFRGDADLRTWLFRIAINVSNSRFRWWKRRGRSSTFSFDSDKESARKIASIEFESPEQTALKKEREKILMKALMNLPKHFRDAVILRDIEGFSYEEIADILQVNLGTVKSRISRGREELRRYLSDFEL